MTQTIPHQDDAANSVDPKVQPEPKPAPASSFMVSPLYDGILFIGAPFIGLAIALAVMDGIGLPWVMRPATLFGSKEAWMSLFIAVWTYAHLCAVVFRSHVNHDMYTRFKTRFTLVPLLLFLGLLFSEWLLVTGIVVAVFWDVYHTAMQNFGFCRIYDARQGSFSPKGRRLDVLVNHLLYIGPIVGGLSLAPTLKVVEQYGSLGWLFPIQAANFFIFIQPRLTISRLLHFFVLAAQSAGLPGVAAKSHHPVHDRDHLGLGLGFSALFLCLFCL